LIAVYISKLIARFIPNLELYVENNLMGEEVTLFNLHSKPRFSCHMAHIKVDEWRSGEKRLTMIHGGTK